jgi:hypothetical protein
LPLKSLASVSYKLNIAVCQNAGSLNRQLSALSPELRKKVQIQKKGNLYIASSAPTENKASLQPLLLACNKAFPDAYISIYRPFKATTANTKKELPRTIPEPEKVEEVNASTIADTIIQNRTISNPSMENIPLQDRIKNKMLYLCAYGEEAWSSNILIQIDFFETEVRFTPIIGKVSGKEELYKIENEKLYISRKGLFETEIYSTLEEVTSEYYLISSWASDRKITSIRYYFDLENAKAYVMSLK